MPEVNYEVVVASDKEKHYFTKGQTIPYTMGVIIVRPPFVVGEGFKEAILENYYDTLEHVATTDTATMLKLQTAEYRGDQYTHEIAERISHLLNAPAAFDIPNPAQLAK